MGGIETFSWTIIGTRVFQHTFESGKRQAGCAASLRYFDAGHHLLRILCKLQSPQVWSIDLQERV